MSNLIKYILLPFIPKRTRPKLRKFLQQLELIPFYFSLPKAEKKEQVLVTGADSSHFKSLCQFLTGLQMNEPDLKIVVFDLGLSQTENQKLKEDFPIVILRVFDYSKYPGYFDIKVNAGEYAWKPVILCDVMNEFKCCVCWMDAGNVVLEPLKWVWKITRKVGIYSPHSTGQISDWTHIKTLEYLKAPDSILHKTNLNGACVSVDYYNLKARNLINDWKRFSCIQECIAPKGSSRVNHRQDQAVLSVIAHMSGITNSIPSGCYGFKIHQDID